MLYADSIKLLCWKVFIPYFIDIELVCRGGSRISEEGAHMCKGVGRGSLC